MSDSPPSSTPALAPIVRQLCALVTDLERMFAGRRFTLDGHLLGSIGEVLAAERYDLVLLRPGEQGHDAITADGRRVQIKTTRGRSVGLRSEPDHLLVVRLSDDAELEEVYYGPGAAAWAACGRPQSNGQRSIRVSKLRKLMADCKHLGAPGLPVS